VGSSKNMIRIVFFGTGEFAAEMLRTLLKDGHYAVDFVITQPDRPVGRNKEIKKSAVKILAEETGEIKILQPEKLKTFDETTLRDLDLAVVCEYGLIIPRRLLEATKNGFINVHPSLLPKFRGASPIQTALVSGEKETGATIMLMDEKMDHGPILAQEKISVEADDTFATLTPKLARLSAELLLKTLPVWLAGKIKPLTQDETAATFCKIFERDDGRLDFSKQTADEIYNLWRGLNPWPGVWTTWQNKRLKLLEIKKAEQDLGPGKIETAGGRIFIGTAQAEGLPSGIEILRLQIEGGKPLSAREFLNGHKDFGNSIF